ncbi:MAG: hypothetical protein LAT55_02000 [Opitutales bacterium]|nr:hypothetical protein [Opitutales bacterium]
MTTNKKLHTCGCPSCKDTRLKKFFTRGDYVVIGVFAVLFFPIALWILKKPRHHYCKACGHSIHAKEKGSLVYPISSRVGG